MLPALSFATVRAPASLDFVIVALLAALFLFGAALLVSWVFRHRALPPRKGTTREAAKAPVPALGDQTGVQAEAFKVTPEGAQAREADDASDPLDSLDWEDERDAQTWQDLAWAFEEAGRHEEAARALHGALAALEEDQADRALELHQELGSLYMRRELLREAYPHFTAACACAEAAFGSPSAQQARALNALGALLERQGGWAQARAKYAEALAAEQGIHDEASVEVAAAHSAIARMCERLAEWPDALQHYREAYRALSGRAGLPDSRAEDALEDVRRAYAADGRAAEAFAEWLGGW